MAHAVKTTIRAIDLFCGGGGSSWGAKLAGVDVVAAFDRWDLAGKNHHENFPSTQFYLGPRKTSGRAGAD
jgi:site-specific DNA-cytosine methylase